MDVTEKRVVVIGNGASAVQCVAALKPDGLPKLSESDALC